MESSIESNAFTPPPTAPGWSLSGKAFLLPFVTSLAILLALILAIAFQFQAIMQRLDQTRSAWPAASTELAARYEAFGQQLRSSDTPESAAALEPWNREHNAFVETTQYDRQLQHASRLEAMIGKELPKSEAIDRWLQWEQKRVEAQTSTIGRWTIFALRLKLPETYTPKS